MFSLCGCPMADYSLSANKKRLVLIPNDRALVTGPVITPENRQRPNSRMNRLPPWIVPSACN
jgi:hypothetical protein